MGHWAQYRHRGSNPLGTAPLPAPPAPVISHPGADLIQTAGGVTDTGGRIEIWGSQRADPGWSVLNTAAWSSPKDWIATAALAGFDIRCLEVGNGIVYQGTSPWSNQLSF